MRTELQRQTARLNGAKSRGPLTAAGKERSSQNARRHGLYSRRILSEGLPGLPTPALPNSTTPEAAVHRARLEYSAVVALETRILSEEVERQRPLHPAESGMDLIARAWRHLCDTGVIEALLRLDSSVSRRLLLATRRLHANPLDDRPEELSETQFRETNPAACPPETALTKAENSESNPADRPADTAATKSGNRETNQSLSLRRKPRSHKHRTNPFGNNGIGP